MCDSQRIQTGQGPSRYLYAYLPNDPAVRLYESLGFVVTGIEPEVVRLHGVFHDVQHMSLGHV